MGRLIAAAVLGCLIGTAPGATAVVISAPKERPDWWAKTEPAAAVQPFCSLGEWMAVGPFADTDGRQLHRPLAPEAGYAAEATFQSAAGGEIRWTAQPTWWDGTAIDLKPVYPPGDRSIAYMHRSIDATRAGRVLVSVNSDDGCACWFDEKQIFLNPMEGGVDRNLIEQTIDVSPGQHQLLLKVVNNLHGWGFDFRWCEVDDAEPKALAKQQQLAIESSDASAAVQPELRLRLVHLYRHLGDYHWALHHARSLLHEASGQAPRAHAVNLLRTLLPFIRRDRQYRTYLQNDQAFAAVAGCYDALLEYDLIEPEVAAVREQVASAWLDVLGEREDWEAIVRERVRLAPSLPPSERQRLHLAAGTLLHAGARPHDAIDAFYAAIVSDPKTPQAHAAALQLIDSELASEGFAEAKRIADVTLQVAHTPDQLQASLRQRLAAMLGGGADATACVRWLEEITQVIAAKGRLPGPGAPGSMLEDRHATLLLNAGPHAEGDPLVGGLLGSNPQVSAGASASLVARAREQDVARDEVLAIVRDLRREMLQDVALERAMAGDVEAARSTYVEILATPQQAADPILDGLLETFRTEQASDDAAAINAMRQWFAASANASVIETVDWYAARRLYRGAHNDLASTAFSEFRRDHPESPRADEALLMIGLTHAHSSRHAQALEVFEQLKSAPSQQIARRAQLLIAWMHLFERNYAAARHELEAFVQRHPEGEEAERARSLLLQLTQTTEVEDQ